MTVLEKATRLLAAFLIAPPIAVAVLSLIFIGIDPTDYRALDPEGVGYFFAAILVGLPGLLAAILLAWLMMPGLSVLPKPVARLLIVLAAALICTVAWVASVAAIGVGDDYEFAALSLPFTLGTLAGVSLCMLFPLNTETDEYA